jgi:hypothetical protein
MRRQPAPFLLRQQLRREARMQRVGAGVRVSLAEAKLSVESIKKAVESIACIVEKVRTS